MSICNNFSPSLQQPSSNVEEGLDYDVFDIISGFSDDELDLLEEFSDFSDLSSSDGVTTVDANTGSENERSSPTDRDERPPVNHNIFFPNDVQNDPANQYEFIQDKRLQNPSSNFQHSRILSSVNCNDGPITHTSKRIKREERLVKNREAANKSRTKRKNQLTDMEEAVKQLNQKNVDLQQQCAALRAENMVLVEQNNFLKNLISDRGSSHQLSSNRPSLSGVACLGVVFMTTFFGDKLLSVFTPSLVQTNRYNGVRSSGRVLLSIDNPVSIHQSPSALQFSCVDVIISIFRMCFGLDEHVSDDQQFQYLVFFSRLVVYGAALYIALLVKDRMRTHLSPRLPI
eukprot:gene9689-20143_t